jgi:hypothetical protein
VITAVRLGENAERLCPGPNFVQAWKKTAELSV